MIISHRSFRFKKPKFPTQDEYYALKQKFRNNPNLSLYRNITFWDYFGVEIKKGILYPSLIAIIFIILMVLTDFALFEWISAILCIFLFARIFIYSVWEWGSFLASNYDRKSYYTKLKKKILKSDDYNDFKKRNKLWMIMHPKN